MTAAGIPAADDESIPLVTPEIAVLPAKHPELAELAPLTLWMIVVAAMTGSILEVLDTTVTTTAIPQMMGNLGATLSEIGWVNTAYIVANVIVLPMAGWLAKRLGRRRYFAGAVLVFTAASFFCATSTDLSTLVFWRIVQGLGGGGLLATGQVILLDSFPKRMQAAAIAIYGAGVMSAPIFGPVLGGFLTENYSWPYIFYINIPFGLISAAAAYGFVHDAPGERTGFRDPIDFLGIVLLAIGMGALQTVLERGREEDWFSSRFIVTLSGVSLIGTVLFVIRQLRTAHPVVDLRVLRCRSLAVGSIYAWVLGFGIYGLAFLLPVYLQTLRGYNSYQSGMVQFPSGMAVMLSFILAGLFSQKIDPRVMMFFGTIGMIAGSAALGYMSTDTPSSYIIFCMAIRGIAVGFLFVPLTLNSLSRLAPGDKETGSAAISFTRQLGGSMGIAMLSTMLSRSTDTHRANIAAHMGADNTAMMTLLHSLQAALFRGGSSAPAAHDLAMRYIAQLADRQAAMMAFNDCFFAIAVAFAIALPLVVLFKRPAPGARFMGH